MKKVLVFGTFDIVHPGHLYFLREAKKHGDYLTVVVTPSSVVKKLKGGAPIFNDRERVSAVVMAAIADRVVIGDRMLSSFSVIRKHKPDAICLGYDQKWLLRELKEFIAREELSITLCVMYAFQPHVFKSSKIKQLTAVH